jgi:hypothetical protein
LKNFISGAPFFSHRHASHVSYPTFVDEVQTSHRAQARLCVAKTSLCRRDGEVRPTTAEGVSIDVTGFTPVTASI